MKFDCETNSKERFLCSCSFSFLYFLETLFNETETEKLDLEKKKNVGENELT
jgi:hypothetical protein